MQSHGIRSLNDYQISWQDEYEALAQRWRVHNAAKFPSGHAGLDLNGRTLAMLDSAAAMLIMKFVDKATLSEGGIRVLKEQTENIRSALPTLQGNSRKYFAELVEIAEEASRLACTRNPTSRT